MIVDILTMSGIQPSVFMIGQRTLPDPVNNDPVCWVTIFFDERMAETHWDEDLLEYVLLELQRGRGRIGHRSHHRLGCKCISLPVTGVSLHDKDEVRKTAANITRGWLQRVHANQVRLDRDRIFFRLGGVPPGPPRVLEEEHERLERIL